MGSDINTVDPHVNALGNTIGILRHVYDGLVTQDADGKIIGQVADSWQATDDRTWVFKLKPNLKFHNGEKIDAEAAKFSIARFRSPEMKNSYASELALIDSVDAVDSTTLKISTKAPFGTLPNVLAYQVLLVPPAEVQAKGAKFTNSGDGSGPFKLVEWKPGEHVVLEAFPGYWGGAPKVGQITFRPIAESAARITELKTGGAEVIWPVSAVETSAIESAGGTVYSRRSELAVQLWMKLDQAPFNDQRVRLAINYALDKQMLIDSIMKGAASVINSPIGPDLEGYNPNLQPYPYDPAKAKQLLADAGFPNGFDTTLEGPSDRYPQDKLLTEAIAAQLTQVGIRATPKTSQFQTLIQGVIKKTVPFLLFGIGNGGTWRVLPAAFYSKTPGNAWYGYKDADFDAGFEKALATTNQQDRIKIVQGLAQKLHDDAVYGFLFNLNDLYGLSKRVKGFVERPATEPIFTNVTVS